MPSGRHAPTEKLAGGRERPGGGENDVLKCRGGNSTWGL